MPMLAQTARRRLEALAEDHVLRVLFEEHRRLLAFLDELDERIEEFRDEVGTPHARPIAARIAALADELADAEPHHAREEQVLFRALEQKGIAMPPRIMRQEHEDLRALKRRLAVAATATVPDSEEIAEAAGTLAARLREHIAKENEILYPMALDAIAPAEFAAMKGPFARIGPCAWGEDLLTADLESR